jgi:hypothetical protein
LKQSVRAYSLYSIAVKKKLQMETADVSLDQNPQGIHLKNNFIVNHTKAV